MAAEPHDVIGIGVGPFNLGLACLAHPLQDLDSVFLERKGQFDWHGGTLLETATLQTPFLCDLVTLADPTSPFSFLNYLKQTGRIYAFYATLLDTDDFFVLRNEFNAYFRWAVAQLDTIVFNREVENVTHDPSTGLYRVSVRNTKMGLSKDLFARRLVLGSGMIPAIPGPCEAHRDRLIHTADYMSRRDEIRSKKSITVIGSGQSAAEVYHDLLTDIDRHGYRLDWYTRSPRLVPRELTKLTLQVTTPDYADYFFSLPRDRREALVRSMQAIFKGINPTLINDIFDLRYRKVMVGDIDATLMSNTEIEAVEPQGEDGPIRLTLRQLEEGRSFTTQSEAVILGTGYRFRPPDFLEGIRDRINWAEGGRFKVARNCSIDREGGEIFVLNSEIHADAYLPADLGQGAFRSSVILREITGREVYPVEKTIAFQRFSAPVSVAPVGTAAAAGSD